MTANLSSLKDFTAALWSTRDSPRKSITASTLGTNRDGPTAVGIPLDDERDLLERLGAEQCRVCGTKESLLLVFPEMETPVEESVLMCHDCFYKDEAATWRKNGVWILDTEET